MKISSREEVKMVVFVAALYSQKAAMRMEKNEREEKSNALGRGFKYIFLKRAITLFHRLSYLHQSGK